MASLGCPPDLPCPGWGGKVGTQGAHRLSECPALSGFIVLLYIHIDILYIYMHIYIYVYIHMIYVTVYLSFGTMFWNVWTLRLVSLGAWKKTTEKKQQWSQTSNFLAVLNLELNTDSVQKMEPEKMIREMGVLQGALGFLGPRDLLSRSTCQVFLNVPDFYANWRERQREFLSSLIDLGRPLGPIR